MKEKLKELTLLMLYLQSWKECDDVYPRSWKGYDFDILNELSDEGLTIDSKRAKSVLITEEGISRAKEIAEKYGISVK